MVSSDSNQGGSSKKDPHPVPEAYREDPSMNSTFKDDDHQQLKEVKGGVSWLPVSVVFKRTCYKCGNLGHHADDCDSGVRLCYNCKEPGHESADCPSERSVEQKQCYFCKEVGHIQTQCPRLRAISSAEQQRDQQQHQDQPQHQEAQNPRNTYEPQGQANANTLRYLNHIRQSQKNIYFQPQQRQQQPLYYAVPDYHGLYAYPQPLQPPNFQHAPIYYTQGIPGNMIHQHAANYMVIPIPIPQHPMICNWCGETGHAGKACRQKRR